MVSHWSLSNSKSPQVFRTFLCILADLNTAVVWMVSTRPLLSKSSSRCTNPLATVPSAPVRIGITVTFRFRNFFSSLARSWYLPLFTFFFGFTQWFTETAKSTIRPVPFLFLFFFCGISLGQAV